MKKNNVKRMAASLTAIVSLCVTPAVTCISSASTAAADSVFPYTMFAASSAPGAITVNSKHLCMNGSMASNGTIVTPNQAHINGQKNENAQTDMIYIGSKLDSAYFGSAQAVEFVDITDHNINLNKALDVSGSASLNGNVNLNTSIKADDDIHISGNVSNANNAVLYSEFGDIIIDSNNVNLSGLVYAPVGNVVITANNINLNNVVIIADTITLTSNNVNANYGSNYARTAGTESTETEAAYIAKMNSWRLNNDINATVDLISQYYNVTPMDAGEYANLVIMGMPFDVKQYNVEGYGNLCVMKLDCPFMQMSTIVLSPYSKEMPLISTDYMYTGANRINYVEFYEVCADANDAGYKKVMEDLSVLPDRYSDLMTVQPAAGWYDEIRPLGLYKATTYKTDDRSSAMLNDSFRIALESSVGLPELSDEAKVAKKAAIQQYSDNLVDMGGISTDMFKQVLGVEKTKDFFNSVFFGTTKF